ncbi:MAG: hypothetical protein A3D13_08785 [Planctomycetes bacterium RIFCSPHIGHO2_02_FULL_40_12]|nr:MAG: hypothetical protein A3D13_08785 [Planctomycetes bacterium RIFCSPHIGHO2_02_FULL_40_12]
MFFKILTTALLVVSFVFTLVSYLPEQVQAGADEPVFREIEYGEEPINILPDECLKKCPAIKEFTNEPLHELEKGMKLGLDGTSFPELFSKYILDCMRLNEHKRAIDFFLTLAGGNQTSPHALTAKGIVTYGWRGQMLLQKGLDCIESAIENDNDNFFSRINHAIFIAWFPNGFVKSMYEFSTIRQTEENFPQRLNLINRSINYICSQHGHDRIPKGYVEPVIKQRL